MAYPLEPDPPAPEPPLPEPGEGQLRGSDQIQGNILAGFRKDHQQLLFISFSDGDARGWLGELLPRVATTKQVATFNELFSLARRAGGGDPEDLTAVWINISLTAGGIKALAGEDPFAPDRSDAFTQGATESATDLGDAGLSGPENWMFGRSDQTIGAVLTVQADLPVDLGIELARQYEALSRHGLNLVFEQPGATLPGRRAGHEHFGFKDGISQPGVRGFDSSDQMNPEEVAGHPGTDIIEAGEFVLGYHGQGRDRRVPVWMHDGSFHVIRRLDQDVAGWWAQVETQCAHLPDAQTGPDLLAAKLVGRWRSGTPIANAPVQDLRSGQDPGQDNNFDYSNDPDGIDTPRFAHIRKVYPRKSDPPGADVSDQHRIIRRGIPFGLPFDPGLGRGYGVDAERGLVFASYMASIEDQFEFLQKTWANNMDFPIAEDGADPVIGIDSDVTLKRPNLPDATPHFARFVTTRGALYAFAPALDTLRTLASGQALQE